MFQQLHDAILTNSFTALFDSDVSELETFLFCLPARIGDLAFVTQLNCVMLTLVVLPLLNLLLFLLLLMVPLSLIGLSTLLVSMLLQFLIMKVLTFRMKKDYT